jgi:hypothetical protein
MVGQEGERSGHLDREAQVTLHWDEDQPIDIAALRGVLDGPRTESWSSVLVGPEEPFDGIWLRLTSTEPGTCRLACTPSAVQAGVCTPAIPTRSPAVVEGASLAYLSIRHSAAEDSDARWELVPSATARPATNSPNDSAGRSACGMPTARASLLSPPTGPILTSDNNASGQSASRASPSPSSTEPSADASAIDSATE